MAYTIIFDIFDIWIKHTHKVQGTMEKERTLCAYIMNISKLSLIYEMQMITSKTE